MMFIGNVYCPTQQTTAFTVDHFLVAHHTLEKEVKFLTP